MGKEAIPFIKVEAKDNYDFGLKLGRALRKQIQYRLKKNKEMYRKKAIGAKDFSVLVKKAKKFLPEINKRFPKLLIEAKGMAEGADIPFNELFVLMCETEIIDFKILHCISIAIKTRDNKILLGNNEDWFPEYRKNGLVLIKGKIKNNKFLALSYIGNLAGSACGLNSNGIAYTDNSFIPRGFRYGIPRSFQLRALLDVKNSKEAIKILDYKKSIVSNTMIAYSGKEAIAVEELPRHKEVFECNRFLVHTNHPLNKRDQNKKNTQNESLFRHNVAKRILLKEKKFSIDTFKKIFTNHERKYDTTICEHGDQRKEDLKVTTISSVIINTKDKWMLVCHGNPCRNKYKKYFL